MTPADGGEGPRFDPFKPYNFADTEMDALDRHDETFEPRRTARPGLFDRLTDRILDIRSLIDRWNNYATRAATRYLSASTFGAPGWVGLFQMPDAAGNDRLICLALLAGSAIAVAWLLTRNWFNAGRGMLFGAGLWLLSAVWWNSAVLTVLAVWQYVMASNGGEAGDLGEFIFDLVIGGGVFIACTVGLKRLDPDY